MCVWPPAPQQDAALFDKDPVELQRLVDEAVRDPGTPALLTEAIFKGVPMTRDTGVADYMRRHVLAALRDSQAAVAAAEAVAAAVAAAVTACDAANYTVAPAAAAARAVRGS